MDQAFRPQAICWIVSEKMMTPVGTALGILVLGMALVTVPARAASTYEDLKTVILLQGHPCPQVTTFEKRAEDDWIAKCTGGATYRVFKDDQGRVRVTKR